jgi:hypothetical protein
MMTWMGEERMKEVMHGHGEMRWIPDEYYGVEYGDGDA